VTQLASDFDAPADVAAAVSFLAPTRHGALRLAVQRRSDPPSQAAASLRAAALLAEAEPLLQWLEDWLGEPLDPEPSPAAPDASIMRLHWRWGDVAATADLPWPALLACRPAAELAGFWRDAVRWDELALQLVLSQEDLSDDEWRDLQQPGAGWLLRESFDADGGWPCELRLPLGPQVHAWPATWRPGRGRLTWSDAAPRQRSRQPEGALAVLAAPLRMTPPALLGWHGEMACECRADQPVSLLPAPRHGPRALAARLLPVGLRPRRADDALDGAALHAGYVLRVEA